MTPVFYHPKDPAWIGGRRLCVVFKAGRKFDHLLDVGSLEVYRVPKGTRGIREAPDVSLKRVARIAGDTLKVRKKVGPAVSVEVEKAIRSLKAEV